MNTFGLPYKEQKAVYCLYFDNYIETVGKVLFLDFQDNSQKPMRRCISVYLKQYFRAFDFWYFSDNLISIGLNILILYEEKLPYNVFTKIKNNKKNIFNIILISYWGILFL
jgi:hypothetical protein